MSLNDNRLTLVKENVKKTEHIKYIINTPLRDDVGFSNDLLESDDFKVRPGAVLFDKVEANVEGGCEGGA
jgi:hypothetical protein